MTATASKDTMPDDHLFPNERMGPPDDEAGARPAENLSPLPPAPAT